ncbi:hypothetical protein [Anaerophaga thermohalophila]|uniref:hypothetical protein n=1 Tax=Anaerophaga thermohalophila TaxID=177400 RepID=UPI00037C8C9A|nr:hypothetical protein [Anaerophaga thermohalophila]
MRIGNNIHTTNNKKPYRKPVLESVDVDRDIVLMGGSEPTDFPGAPSISTQTENQTTSKDNEIFKESQNPFGGGTPNYDYDR